MKFFTASITLQTQKTPKKRIKSVYSTTPTFISHHISEIVMFPGRQLRKNLSNNT